MVKVEPDTGKQQQNQSRYSPIFLTLFLCFVACTEVQAASPVSLATRVITAWQNRDGLPQQTVKSILQSRDGFIWAATRDGLTRFDGVTFTDYTTANTNGLATDDIDSLLEDAGGYLWIVGENGVSVMHGGVFANVTPSGFRRTPAGAECRLDPRGRFWLRYNGNFYQGDSGRLTLVVASDGNRPSSAVWTVDVSGTVWYAGARGEVERADGAAITPFVLGPSKSAVHSIAADSTGRVWIASDQGVDVIEGGHARSVAKAETIGKNPSLTADGHGDVWVLNSGSLYRIVDDRLAAVNDWRGIRLDAISINPAGDLLCWYAGAKNVAISVNRSFVYSGVRSGLSGKPLSCVRDAQGDIWVGTDNGLDCIRDRACQTFGVSAGLGASAITSILVDLGARIWVAERDGSVYQYQGDAIGKFRLMFRNPRPVKSLTETADGVYLCIVDGEVMEMDGGKTKPYAPVAADLPKLGQAMALAVGSGGDVWLTGEKAVLNIAHGVETWYSFSNHGNVITTFADDAKRHWISTEDGLFEIKDGALQRCRVRDSQLDTPINSILEDETGKIWFGHRGGGLTRFAHGEFRTITRRDGLPSSTISQMSNDNADNIWFGTPKEIFRISVKELNAFVDSHVPFHAYTYGQADGNVGGSCLSGRQIPMIPSLGRWESNVWFPCQFGIVRISSTSSAGNPVPVVFERITFDGRPATATPMAVIKPGEGNAIFRFTALDLKDPEHLQFSYRLEGFDQSWIDAGQLRQAIYTNLPPGTYRFDLKCINVDGGWSAQRSFQFSLQPHVYQTWWFKILAFLAIALAVFAYARARILALQERNRVLLDLQTELEAQNDELSASHSRLETQNEELSDLQAELEAQNSELTESKAALETVNARLQALATTDGLTGLMNHRTFQEDLHKTWESARRRGRPLSLLLIDVDHFKLFNDEYGHQAGDQVLIKVGQSLKFAARDVDTVARYGGEEFAVILRDTDSQSAIAAAERFRQTIQQNVWGERAITASIGVSTIRPEMGTTDALIAAADIALYSSKGRGRNCVTHSDDDTSTASSSILPSAWAA